MSRCSTVQTIKKIVNILIQLRFMFKRVFIDLYNHIGTSFRRFNIANCHLPIHNEDTLKAKSKNMFLNEIYD